MIYYYTAFKFGANVVIKLEELESTSTIFGYWEVLEHTLGDVGIVGFEDYLQVGMKISGNQLHGGNMKGGIRSCLVENEREVVETLFRYN